MLSGGIGEWISAYVFFGLAFTVAVVGVGGLGAWVLRGDARNRRAQIHALREQEHTEDRPLEE
jgi:ABC-type proline/glycine betaine transport system permease subunit